jgi:hypothetical protein
MSNEEFVINLSEILYKVTELDVKAGWMRYREILENINLVNDSF